ncbi:hypothetical protein COM97_03725 [Bacillus thuringiensis]|uniref:hypothetical protein n=1 Tax=Bacillus cereus group TaxID=86661 RepID=UPI000BEE5956|nr:MULTISPECIES: hypothetical protein [Bacillus cereus group]PEF07926.1 hypothetical protein COM97_03725 [Bacillus thuringiensis]PFY98340.1 hypothetical protein COL57_10665 [Bacillus wiedmannii]
MPVERIMVTGYTLEEAKGKFGTVMLEKDIDCFPHEMEIIDCTNDDTDYNWMIIYKPYGY